MKLYTLISVLLIIVSCNEKDDIKPIIHNSSHGIFIVNEGNFQFGNASLSYLNFSNQKMYNNIFSITNEIPLGDVAQSITIIDSLGFIVLNNSAKIYIININNFKYINKIIGFNSPRYILPLINNKAYVSELYGENLKVIDTKLFTITKSIDLKASSEAMIYVNNKVFVTSWSYNNKIFVINPLTDSVIDTIIVGKQPNSMVVDKNNKLWVLCDGGFFGSSYQQENAKLVCVDTENHQIEKEFVFNNISDSPIKLNINANFDTLFYINNSIYRMSISDNNLPTNKFIDNYGKVYYCLKISNDSKVYITDTKDYVNNGSLLIYDSYGTFEKEYEVGVLPGYICIK